MASRWFPVRLLLTLLALAAGVASVSLGLGYWVSRDAVYLDQVRTLGAAVAIVGPAVEWTAADATPLRALSKRTGARITVIAGDGAVRFDTDADVGQMANHNDRPEVIEARRMRLGSSSHFSQTLRQNAVYLAETVDANRPGGTVVRVCYVNAPWASLRTPIWAVMAGVLATAALMVTALAAVLQRQWVRPTRDAMAAATRMAGGDWDARVGLGGSDVVRQLGATLNRLAAQAQNQLAEIGKQRRDLRSLVDALPDPILVTDAAGRVVLVNVPAAGLLELSPARVVGQKTVSVVSDEALLQLLEAAGGVAASWAQPPVQREVRLLRRGHRLTFQAVATRTATGGALLALRNVSAMADLVQMKTDFVANASHELRTPIAAIKIAMETLRDVHGEDPQQAGRCIDIIDGHVRRLEEMLRDLLDLSRLESPDAKPRLADVKPWELFAFVRSTFGPTTRQRGIELCFDDQPITPDSFHSDERLLNLVLKNLVENSIKFTPAGGRITVGMRAIESEGEPAVELSVRDTGIGIPAEHRDRVFERFYQVDPARSGTAGRGTGLGLAIVKHAVAALGGTVRLDASDGGGTTATCVLPQDRNPKFES